MPSHKQELPLTNVEKCNYTAIVGFKFSSVPGAYHGRKFMSRHAVEKVEEELEGGEVKKD